MTGKAAHRPCLPASMSSILGTSRCDVVDATCPPVGAGWTSSLSGDITRPTDVRTTVISAVIPWRSDVSYTLAECYLPMNGRGSRSGSICGLLAFDAQPASASTTLRGKSYKGASMSLTYTVEQLPVIAADDYGRLFGGTTARELVRDHVLRLTYTAHDMAPFARDLGYDGPPFTWDEEERRHLRATARRALLPPLRRLEGRRRLHPEHLPHSPPRRRGRVRPLPHPRPHPRLHERPRRGGHGHGRLGVGDL